MSIDSWIELAATAAQPLRLTLSRFTDGSFSCSAFPRRRYAEALVSAVALKSPMRLKVRDPAMYPTDELVVGAAYFYIDRKHTQAVAKFIADAAAATGTEKVA